MTRREELEQAAIEINLDPDLMGKRLLDRLVAVGEWADAHPPKRCSYCGTVDGHGPGCSVATGNVPDEK